MMMTPVVKDVSEVDMAFPAHVIGVYLPTWEEIPEEFKNKSNEWTEWAGYLFFRGGKELKFYPKEGIDPRKALRMISACLGSFEPKHEHKEAGVGYLLATFFERIEK